MDKFSKYDYKGQKLANDCLTQLFSACTLNFEYHYQDKNPIDIEMTATTRSGNEYYYSIECKDRQMNHNKYNDYLIEEHKIRDIKKEIEKGRKGIYLNTFADGYCVCWDLSKINTDNLNTVTKSFYKTEVTKEQYKAKIETKKVLPLCEAIYIGKLL